MPVRHRPLTLGELCLNTIVHALMQQWRHTYYTNYWDYKALFVSQMAVIPLTFVDSIFDAMLKAHVEFIQEELPLNNYQPLNESISDLICSILSPYLHKLNLRGIQSVGVVDCWEGQRLQTTLLNELPNLHNLVDINLNARGWDLSLPICTDEILKAIGSTCFKLDHLDVSYNDDVTDVGLKCLLPSKEQKGCRSLYKVSLFECSVTHEGVVLLLLGLHRLKFLGYKETLQCLRLLYNQSLTQWIPGKPAYQPKLRLAHVNNKGVVGCRDVNSLQCDNMSVHIISELCRKVTGLKIRVNDDTVLLLKDLTSVTLLELFYHTGYLSSPGNNTVEYLKLRGTQFEELSLVCYALSNKCLKTICEQCSNMKRLILDCTTFNSDGDMTMSDRKNCVFNYLEEFNFKIGSRASDICEIPSNTFIYVLHKSCALKEVVLTMRNVLFDDMYIKHLFSSVETSKIKSIVMEMPYKNSLSPLRFSMVTAQVLMEMCPELESLGSLLSWDISTDEMDTLKNDLVHTNTSFTLV